MEHGMELGTDMAAASAGSAESGKRGIADRSGCSAPACVAHRGRAGPSELARHCIIPPMSKDFTALELRQRPWNGERSAGSGQPYAH